MEEQEVKQDETLEEMFKRVTNELKQENEQLKSQVKERDNLIKSYMTSPSKTSTNEDKDVLFTYDGQDYTQDDVTEVVNLVHKKRS